MGLLEFLTTSKFCYSGQYLAPTWFAVRKIHWARITIKRMTRSRKILGKKRFSLIETFKKFDNPFKESQPDLINIVSKEVMSVKAVTSVRNAYTVGKKQCSDFIKERLCNSDDQTMTIYTTVKKNRLALFQSKSIVTVPKIKVETTALKEWIELYSSWYVGCKSRQANLDEFFRPENHEYPPSLSNYVAFANQLRKQISSNVYDSSRMTQTRRLLRSTRL